MQAFLPEAPLTWMIELGADADTADPAYPGDCARLISGALAGGDVDILVNNAGAFANRGWDDAAPEDWLALYATNVAAVVRCIQGFLPVMRDRLLADVDPGRLAIARANLTCLDVNLPPDALARLDQGSPIARGFPHDFLASADFILGGMSGQLDLPPAQSAHG